MKLWAVARYILDNLLNNEQRNIDKIENILKQLDEIDPRSFSFRYSHDTNDMTAYIPLDLRQVNLVHVWEKLDAALGLLDAAADMLLEYRSYAEHG
jgi:hypothetical protein